MARPGLKATTIGSLACAGMLAVAPHCRAQDAAAADRADRQPGSTGSAPQVETFDPYRPQKLPFAEPSSIAPYIALLNVEDFAARTSAAEFILQTPTVSLETLTPYLLDASLPPETRSRVLSMAELLFRVEPRAAMGVQFDRQTEMPVIIRSFPDNPFFRASQVMRAGDEVLEADGRAIGSFDEFQGAILSHDPGDEIHLLVRRNGERMELKVPLGDYMRLGQSTPPEVTLSAAWSIRLDRIMGRAPAEVTPLVDCRPDEPPAGQDEPDAEARGRAVVAGGGVPRGGLDQDGVFVEASPIELDDQTIQLREALRRQGLSGDDLRQAEREMEALVERRARMVQIREQILREIENQNRRLADATLGPEQRREAAELLLRAHQNLATAQNQIDLIDLQLPQRR